MIGLLALTAAALAAVGGRGVDVDTPRPAMVLFWASWCAPCRAELQALPEIERASAPLPVVIVPLTDPRGLPVWIDRRKVRVPEGGGWRYLTMLKLRPALPAAVVIDARGERCAAHAGGIDAAKAASLAAACASIGE